LELAPAIAVKGLCKQFGNHRALDGIDFSVPRGSVYGFLGPNGAGKTTTIKIILSLIFATAGRVDVLGETVVFGKKLRCLSRINYLPQDPVFPEGLNGKEILTLVADIYRLDYTDSRRRIGELLERFQLSAAAGRKVSAYSRGMKQRLGIAAVMLTDPELLILDEPVSALDPEGRRTVLDQIHDLRERATVFFSSHILADVERVCDRVTIIDRGRKLLETATRDLLAQYALEQYVIRVRPEQRDLAARIISEHDAVREASGNGEQLLVTSEPGRAGALPEELLPRLVNAGIVVIEFMPYQVNLEEVFFKVLEQNRQGGGEQWKPC
jgi:ABC-2 type transport system ATP-binding protein